MTPFDIYFTVAAFALFLMSTSRYRKNSAIIALEFGATLLTTYLLLDLEWYKHVGSCWVFGARALILYAAMRATLRIQGHRMIYIVMLIGMIINVGTYFEYALKSYWLFDEYYTPAAQAVMLLQLIYMLGIGYVGYYIGRIRVASVRWWRAYRMSPERRQIIRRP